VSHSWNAYGEDIIRQLTFGNRPLLSIGPNTRRPSTLPKNRLGVQNGLDCSH
jgi:hypothetical protein